MRDSLKEAGTWLRALRQQAGLTQVQLSKIVNARFDTYISQIEMGRMKVPSSQYEIWANAVNMDARQFVVGLLKFYEPAIYNLLFNADTRR